jgi:hypothetical protein
MLHQALETPLVTSSRRKKYRSNPPYYRACLSIKSFYHLVVPFLNADSVLSVEAERPAASATATST